jgi:hypothetical protein
MDIKVKYYYLVCFLCCVFSFNSLAEYVDNHCASEDIEIIKKQLNISNFAPRNNSGVIISSACKQWSYNKNHLITAFAYDSGNEEQKDLYVSIIDKNNRHIIHSLKSTINEDSTVAVGPFSLKLDTAKYQLSDNLRAFGLRFYSSALGPSCGSGYQNDQLTLYIPDREYLRPVLTLNTAVQRWLKGCPAEVSDSLVEEATLTISVANTSSNGFHDLIVTAKIMTSSPSVEPKHKIEHYVLHYNGHSYQGLPQRPWWLDF